MKDYIDSFKAGKAAAHTGCSNIAPSVYDQKEYLKGYNSVKKAYKVTDFKSLAFIGSFSECLEFIVGKTYLKGYVIASYNL